MYHMGVSKFMQMAKDAKAIYKLGQLVLVNLKIFDEYIETWIFKNGHRCFDRCHSGSFLAVIFLLSVMRGYRQTVRV